MLLKPQLYYDRYQEPSRVKEIYFGLPSSHQAWQYLTACMRILLHLRRGARKVVGVQCVRDVGQVTTTEIVCEADQRVKLVLVDLSLLLVNHPGASNVVETCDSGTHSNIHIFVDACLERICITVEEVLALSLGNGWIDVVAFTCCLASVAVADRLYALITNSISRRVRKADG